MEAITKRRHRGTRTSTGARIRVQLRDIAVFKALYEHGPLPTHYLYEFAKPLAPSYAGLKMRLTDLFHEEETEHGEPTSGDQGRTTTLSPNTSTKSTTSRAMPSKPWRNTVTSSLPARSRTGSTRTASWLPARRHPSRLR